MELLIDPHLALGNIAASGQKIVDDLLRKDKSRSVGSCRVCQILQLPVLRQQRLDIAAQHTELTHCVEMTGYRVPSEESLSFTAGITPFPNQNTVIIGLVADTGIVGEHDFGEIIVEDTADIFDSPVVIGYTFKISTDILKACPEVRSGSKDLINDLIDAEKRIL